MAHQNGGTPTRTCHRTSSRTTWPSEHVALAGIFAIGAAKPKSGTTPSRVLRTISRASCAGCSPKKRSMAISPGRGASDRAAGLIAGVTRWARAREDVLGVALVGSHARGEARVDSDVDLVIVCIDRARYLAKTDWLAGFGEVESAAIEDWGKVQSLRVQYADQLEMDLGFAETDWTEVPPDPGTAAVLRAGCVILLDRDGALARVLQSARDSG